MKDFEKKSREIKKISEIEGRFENIYKKFENNVTESLENFGRYCLKSSRPLNEESIFL